MISFKNLFTIILLVFCFFYLTSCKKSPNQYFASFKVNGVKTVCNKILEAKIEPLSLNSGYLISISGNADTCAFSILLKTTLPVSTKVIYSDTANAQALSLNYVGQDGHIYSSPGSNQGMTKLQFQLVTNKLIQGTFSGNTVDYINNPGSRALTEGSFLIQLQ
jgi:hypothetical protein